MRFFHCCFTQEISSCSEIIGNFELQDFSRGTPSEDVAISRDFTSMARNPELCQQTTGAKNEGGHQHGSAIGRSSHFFFGGYLNLMR